MIIREYNNRVEEIGILREGDWLSALDIFKKPFDIYSVITMEPSKLLTLTEAAFLSLNAGLQNIIVKNINYFSLQVINWLGNSQKSLTFVNHYLTSYLQENLFQQGDAYGESEIITTILTSVPRLPVYVNTLLNMLTDGSSSSRDVSTLAREDPSLVGEILKTVNSAYFSLRNKVSDFHHAVVLLGFNQVHQLVVANGLLKTMPNTPEFRALHDHSVIVSHLAFMLGQRHGRQIAPMVATIALLHDIGESVIMLLKQRNPKWSVLINVLNSAKLGAMLLREWNIPAEVYTVIEHQNHPRFFLPSEIPIEKKEILATLYIAHRCYECIQYNQLAGEQHPFASHYLQLANLPNKPIGDIVDEYLVPSLDNKNQLIAQHVRNFLLKAQRMRETPEQAAS
jgi:HD-like signal output (HDOD) protein